MYCCPQLYYYLPRQSNLLQSRARTWKVKEKCRCWLLFVSRIKQKTVMWHAHQRRCQWTMKKMKYPSISIFSLLLLMLVMLHPISVDSFSVPRHGMVSIMKGVPIPYDATNSMGRQGTSTRNSARTKSKFQLGNALIKSRNNISKLTTSLNDDEEMVRLFPIHCKSSHYWFHFILIIFFLILFVFIQINN